MQGQGEDLLPHTHKIVPRPRKKAKKKGAINEDRQRKFSQIGD